MKTTQPFGYPVTTAGLPRDWCTIEARGDENIPNLTAQEVAKTFWLLDSIRVEYAYSVNGRRKERDVLLKTHVEPIKRIQDNPSFYYQDVLYDEVNCLIHLEIAAIAHCPKNKDLFHLNFLVQEQDEERLYTLSCNDRHEERLLDSKSFEFMNRELTASLWTLSMRWTGHIEYFRATPEYYTVREWHQTALYHTKT